MKKNIYSILLDMVAEAKKCDNLVQTMNLVNLTVGDLLDNKIIVDEPNSTEQKEKALLEYCVVIYGKEKTRFSHISEAGIEIHIGNYIYDGKIYFVVSANGNVKECLEVSKDE